MIWKESKAGNYSIKLMYESLNSNLEINKRCVPCSVNLELFVFAKSGAFSFKWGGLIGQGLEIVATRGRSLAWMCMCFLYVTEEETIEHLEH